jgi:hypothetical protein
MYIVKNNSSSLLYLRSELLDSVHASDELGMGQNSFQHSKYPVVVVTNTIQECGIGVIFY